MDVINFNGFQVDIWNSDGSVWNGVGEAWFVAQQIATAIRAADPSKYSSNLLIRNPEKFEGFKGSLKLRTPGGMQEFISVNENGLYMFLIASDLPDAVGFQRKVTNVLKNIRQGKTTITSHASSDVEDLIILQAQSMKEVKAKVAYLEVQAIKSRDTLTTIKETFLQQDEDWRKWVKDTLNNAANRMGGGKERFQELRSRSYEILTIRAKCKLDTRVDWLKKRLFEAGAGKTRINNANKLDCIEEDHRLKEIYTAIVKELSIGTL